MCVARSLKIGGTVLGHEAAARKEHDSERGGKGAKKDETCTRGNPKSRP